MRILRSDLMAKIDHLDRKEETLGLDEREILERKSMLNELEEVVFKEAISCRQKMKRLFSLLEGS